MALYEILVLGSPTIRQQAALEKRVAEMAASFSLDIPDDIVVRYTADVKNRNPKAAAVALYFGGDPSVDADQVDALEAAKVPVIPVVDIGINVSKAVPASIAPVNACLLEIDDIGLEALASVVFEAIGLLHRQRRIFVSYRRSDSREAALQLHDQLDGRGFDVFLDTHDIRPGEDFQEALWHRLADCDVLLMLDTKDYFASKWTKQELGRALALGIQILRVVWPNHKGSRHLSLSDTVSLADADFDLHDRLLPARVTEIARRAEALRSRSIATRHLDLVGRLRVEVERIGGRLEGIGAHRAVSLTLPNGGAVEAYPMVGVPTAALLNEVHDKSKQAGHGRFPCLVYNDVGIRPAWQSHLAWLDANIDQVRSLKITNAGWELAKWDS